MDPRKCSKLADDTALSSVNTPEDEAAIRSTLANVMPNSLCEARHALPHRSRRAGARLSERRTPNRARREVTRTTTWRLSTKIC